MRYENTFAILNGLGNMKKLGRFRALLLLFLSTFGLKSYAETIYRQTLSDVGDDGLGKVNFFKSEVRSGESSGNWTVQKEMTKLSSGNWTIEKMNKVGSGNWTMKDTKELLANGNWTSSSPVQYSHGSQTLIVDEVRQSDDWTTSEIHELINSGSYSLEIEDVK